MKQRIFFPHITHGHLPYLREQMTFKPVLFCKLNVNPQNFGGLVTLNHPGFWNP